MMRAFLDNCGEVTHCMPVVSEPVEVDALARMSLYRVLWTSWLVL